MPMVTVEDEGGHLSTTAFVEGRDMWTTAHVEGRHLWATPMETVDNEDHKILKFDLSYKLVRVVGTTWTFISTQIIDPSKSNPLFHLKSFIALNYSSNTKEIFFSFSFW
nr:hypothetical protein CFP56_16109 [Quercus suber]